MEGGREGDEGRECGGEEGVKMRKGGRCWKWIMERRRKKKEGRKEIEERKVKALNGMRREVKGRGEGDDKGVRVGARGIKRGYREWGGSHAGR